MSEHANIAILQSLTIKEM